MGQALYRKYRSMSLAEIVGQEHITTTLEQALKSGRISHAYLFSGPRGVGKTSIARILAHQINNLPYQSDSSHIDIIEIDAASNRRIDEIRELREKVNVAPVLAKYKVYIIDEVHMLTREAFNALLKTLEEPPAHVVFMLATTEAHKLPETIISRTQHFNFKPVAAAAVAKHLRFIAQKEKIVISDQALSLLAEHGEGSFRDSISLLDQAANQTQPIDVQEVYSLLGIPPEESINLLVKCLQTNPQEVIKLISFLYEQGFQAPAIAKQLSRQLRQQLIDQTNKLPSKLLLQLLDRLLSVPASFDPERLLEIVVLEIALSQKPDPKSSLKSETEPAENKSKIKTTVKTNDPKLPPPSRKTESTTPKELISLDESIWPDILAALKKQYNTLYGIIRMAKPDFSQKGKLTLSFGFAFHRKLVSEIKNRQLLTDIIKEKTGQAVEIVCLLSDAKPSTDASQFASSDEPILAVDTISNIFGGGELLKS
ncbi:MAG TPA: DNA polymerase III subunit gamma/tau [Candidatus Dormibacteraeota bacterium]|nr:DNA polymerase III subunit gamma/tau [Candidatus Dormibacteraeota bacterium]